MYVAHSGCCDYHGCMATTAGMHRPPRQLVTGQETCGAIPRALMELQGHWLERVLGQESCKVITWGRGSPSLCTAVEGRAEPATCVMERDSARRCPSFPLPRPLLAPSSAP